MGRPRTIWLLPGMGADHRMYQRLLDAADNLRAADWIAHRPQDDLVGYAAAMATQYAMTADDGLVGVSMGGMVAAQIGSLLGSQRILLVSSATSFGHVHPLLRLLAPLGRVMPFGSAALLPEPILPDALQRLALAMLKDSDPGFLRWSCAALRRWPGVERRSCIVQVHGSRDPVFPISRQRIDAMVPGAGHLLVLTHPEPVRRIIAGWMQG